MNENNLSKNISPENIGHVNEANDISGKWRAILVVTLFIVVGLFFAISEIARVANLDLDGEIKSIANAFLSQPKFGTSHDGGVLKNDSVRPIAPLLPKLVGSMPDPGEFGAAAVVIRDVESGAVLFGKNQYESRPLASVSKLMTALVALDMKPNWQTTTSVIVSEGISDKYLEPGGVYTIRQLWQAGLVPSSNLAILSLVRGLGVSQTDFVSRMNAKARELGMMSTNFEEPTGLSENNVSTASDVIRLLSEALRHEEIRETLLMKSANLGEGENVKKMISTDLILLGLVPTDFKFLGGKTGFTNAAGYNFTMRVENQLGHQVDVVVLGAAAHEDRFTEARQAAEWAFESYLWPNDSGYASTTIIKS